jgi:hypothetical protein
MTFKQFKSFNPLNSSDDLNELFERLEPWKGR